MKATVKKKGAKPKKAAKKDAFADIKMRDLSKEPYFIKKAEEAMEVLRRTGIILKP